MSAVRWAEENRETLCELLPDALVLLAIGATEQHGPHLATGTDALLAATTCERAADAAAERSPRALIIAPTLPFGASDHHLPFNGTLSLTPETLLAVLGDLARSLATQGARRLVVVNGHGGNVGICRAFAEAAAVRHDLSVAYLHYWTLVEPAEAWIPGHAGEFETSMVLAVRQELVGEARSRQVPELPDVADVGIHSAGIWRDIDGYTGQPAAADAERGKRWLDQIVAAMADRFVTLAGAL